jgi:hypothetical protein
MTVDELVDTVKLALSDKGLDSFGVGYDNGIDSLWVRATKAIGKTEWNVFFPMGTKERFPISRGNPENIEILIASVVSPFARKEAEEYGNK